MLACSLVAVFAAPFDWVAVPPRGACCTWFTAGAAPSLSPAFSGRGSSGEPINAMVAPTGADAPSATSILRSTPPTKASISIFTLSVSTSASDSPFLTGSPSCFIQRRILPSSIVSPILGISIFFMHITPSYLSTDEGCWHNRLHGFDDIVFVRQCSPFQHF